MTTVRTIRTFTFQFHQPYHNPSDVVAEAIIPEGTEFQYVNTEGEAGAEISGNAFGIAIVGMFEAIGTLELEAGGGGFRGWPITRSQIHDISPSFLAPEVC